MHNGLVQFGGDKMSKSIGNIVKSREMVDRNLAPAFRLMVLQSHYRAPLTFTEEGLVAADRGLDRLRAAAKPVSSPSLECQLRNCARSRSQRRRNLSKR